MPKRGEPMTLEHRKKIAAALIAREKPIEKRCTQCGIVKLRSEFYPRKSSSPNAIRAECKQCSIDGVANWQVGRRERVRETNWRTCLRRYYGITAEQYDEMLAAQGDVCAICGGTETTRNRKRLYVDHCHRTRLIRGLLCSRCNHGVGAMRDDPDLLKSAWVYLERGRPHALIAVPGGVAMELGTSNLIT